MMSSDGIKIVMGDDGVWDMYDDTWDIIIHCTSEEEHNRAIEKLTNLRWIPCSERFPSESGDYLVWVEEVGCDVASFDIVQCAFGEWHHDALGLLECELLELEDVIAWMPLPQPYREKVE